jgi:O-antigen/teichoic acid export membrane protein
VALAPTQGSAVTDDSQKGPLPGEAGPRLTEEAAKDIGVVAKGGAIQIIGQVSQRGLSFLFGAVVTRFLGPPGYGLYRLVVQIISNLSQVGLLGFNYAVMRFVAKGRAAKDPAAVKGAIVTGITGTVVTSLLVIAATFGFTTVIAETFTSNPETLDDVRRLLLVASPYIFVYALLQVVRYATQAYKTMVPSVMAGNVIQPVARFILAVGALVIGFEEAGILIALNISVVIALVAALWWLRKLMTAEQWAAPAKLGFGPMLRFSVPQAGASLLGVQTLGLGLLLLGRYHGAEEVGLFAIALSLQGPGNVFLGGIVNIWAPVVSDLYDRNEIDRLGSLYKTINRWIATFSFPVFAALMIEPDLFVDLFAGDKGAEAVTAVAILALGNIFYTGTGPTGYVISMTGHPTVNFINSAFAVALYIGLGIAFVPEGGVVAMAWIDVLVTALINSVRVFQAYKLVGIHPFGRTYYKPVVATLVGAAMLGAWHVIPGDNALLDISGIVIGALAYMLTLKRLGIDEEERHVLNRIRKRAIKRK